MARLPENFCQPGLSPVRRRSRQHLAARHQRPRPASTGAALVLSWTDRIPDRSLRAWLRLTNDFRIAPRVRREDREIRLFSRVLALNEQETASGDAESVRFFVGQLAVPCRGAEIDLDSHDRQPFERGRVFDTCHGTGSWASWRPEADQIGQLRPTSGDPRGRRQPPYADDRTLVRRSGLSLDGLLLRTGARPNRSATIARARPNGHTA
jgi:hypothetical protein